MTRSQFVLVFFLTLGFAVVSLSQDNNGNASAAENENPKTAIKIDEFGPQGDCAIGARIDNFFIQLNNNPQATGYIIGYAGTDSLPSQYKESPMIESIHKAMRFRRYDTSRVVIIKGGFRETQRTELYLVPEGGAPPEPSETVPEPELPNGTFLWSRSYLGSDESYQDLTEFILPDVKAKMDDELRVALLQASLEAGPDSEEASAGSESQEAETEADEDELTPDQIRSLRFDWADKKFGSEILSQKGAHGVIIFYADDQYYDVVKLRQFVEEGRDVILAAAKNGSGRIQVVFGGYQDSSIVEYYIVPKGGKPPEPKAEERKPEQLDDQSSE